MKWIGEEFQKHPEFFQVSGAPAPERELFFTRPQEWFKKHLNSKTRQAEWLAGRRAVLKASKGISPFIYSISHCTDWAIACGYYPGQGAQPQIGIDWEHSERIISPRASDRVFSPQENALGLKPLELWTIKEATYKAVRPATSIFIGHVKILSYEPKTQEGRSTLNGQHCKYWLTTSGVRPSVNLTMTVACQAEPHAGSPAAI